MFAIVQLDGRRAGSPGRSVIGVSIRGRAGAAAAGLVALVGGCGSAATPPAASPLASAPEPAVSPPATVAPAGRAVAFPGQPEGVAIDASGTVGVNVRRPDGLVLFPLDHAERRRTVSLGGSARHLTLARPGGPMLVPQESDDRFVQVDEATGAVVAAVLVGRQPHDAIAVGRDSFFVADELANTIHVVRHGRVVRVVAAPLQPGGMAEAPDGSVVVADGVRGRRITAYRPDGTAIGSANCGAGPTHAVTGSDGLYWVVDTLGGAVLGFRVGADGPRQVVRIPVGSRPYGVAYDERRSTLWVTLTGSNQLVGLHLRGTAVQSRTIEPTVRQPNTVAVFAPTGELVVTGSTAPGQLQLLG